MSTEMKVKTGVAVLVLLDPDMNRTFNHRKGCWQVLMGKRKGAHGSGQWSFPGGKIDPGETSVQAARRELFEETGIDAEDKDFQLVMSNLHYFPEIDTEYVTIFFKVEQWSGPPVVKEPHKIDGDWEWIDIGSWPHPLFEPVTKLVEEGGLG